MAKQKLEQLTLEFADEVEELARKYHPILISHAYGDAQGVLGITVDFELENREVQRVLNRLAKNIRGVPETVRDNVRLLIGQSAENGWSNAELALHILDTGATDSPHRAELIAVSEAARGYSLGSELAWSESGVVSGKEWLVADGACEICGPLGDTVVDLNEEFAPGISVPGDSHPRCRCAISPILG